MKQPKIDKVTQEMLMEKVYYNPEAGTFHFIMPDGMPSKKQCGSIDDKGYVRIFIGGKTRKAHRMAWLYVHGDIPDDMQIDHINMCKSDNRIANLRLADGWLNMHNQKKRKINTTGVKNVQLEKATGRWYINVRGRGKRLSGRFDCLLDAVAEKFRFEKEVYGDFVNHG
jgi:hypothetical protein